MCYNSIHKVYYTVLNFLRAFARHVLFFPSLYLICLILQPLPAHAEVTSHTKTIVFSSTGFSNLSGDKSQQKERATLAAKFLAERKLEDLLKNLTTSQNLAFLQDNWQNSIEYFNTSDFNDTTLNKDKLFGVTISGKVTVSIPGYTELNTNTLTNSFLNINFTSNKSIYFEGEEVVFGFEGNKDFFACILDLNNQNEIIQLLPNTYRSDNFFKGNTKYFFPELATGDKFRFEVSPPYGTDKVHIIASPVPLETILPLHHEEVFPMVKDDIKTILNPVHTKLLTTLSTSTSIRFFKYTQLTSHIITLTTQKSSGQN